MLTISTCAVVAVSSRSTSIAIEAMLAEYDLQATLLSTGQAFHNALSLATHTGLAFVSFEVLKEIDENPACALKKIREQYFGPLYVLSANHERHEDRQLIEQGATDIIDMLELTALRGILNTYALFQKLNSTSPTLTALIVEDSVSHQKMISAVLLAYNVKSHQVDSAQAALSVLKNEAIDLIITDVHLTGEMTGMHLLREICQSTVWQGIPVVVISGVVPGLSIKSYFQLGARDFMSKPLDVELFELKIKNIIRERRTFLELQKERKKLADLAFSDTLTELPNRALLRHQYEAWARERNHRFFTAMIDVDNLKSINDQVGHDAGDHALMALANLMRQFSQPEELAIRLGSDEFLLFWLASDQQSMEARLTTLLADIALVQVPGYGRLSASIGATCVQGELALTEVLKRCDGLMYVAKSSGKNQVVFEC